jgi:hypothetical protein
VLLSPTQFGFSRDVELRFRRVVHKTAFSECFVWAGNESRIFWLWLLPVVQIPPKAKPERRGEVGFGMSLPTLVDVLSNGIRFDGDWRQYAAVNLTEQL